MTARRILRMVVQCAMFAGLTFGQTTQPAIATVIFKPLDSPALLGVVGPAKGQVSGWEVEVRAGASPVTLSREAIMALAPAIHELPESVAQDVLSRISSNTWKSGLSSALTDLAASGGPASAAVGVIKSNKIAMYAGAASTAVAFVVKALKSNAPNPAPYFGNLLPGSVSLAANAGGTWFIASQPVGSPVTIGPLPIY